MTNEYGPGNLNAPWDIVARPPYYYVANLSGAATYQILQFTLDAGNNFVLAGHYGTTGTTSPPGIFFGPRRFLAVRSDALIIVDSDTGTDERLVSFADINGAGWATYGSFGNTSTGIGHFKFWSLSAC